MELQCDGVRLAHHEVMSPWLQPECHVRITAGSGSVRTVAELEVDVFFMDLNHSELYNQQI